MPALINNRLAQAIGNLPADVSCEDAALAAYRVIEGCAVALGLPSTGVSFFKPGGHPKAAGGYVIEWLDGPTQWAFAAQHQDEPRRAMIWSLPGDLALEFLPVAA